MSKTTKKVSLMKFSPSPTRSRKTNSRKKNLPQCRKWLRLKMAERPKTRAMTKLRRRRVMESRTAKLMLLKRHLPSKTLSRLMKTLNQPRPFQCLKNKPQSHSLPKRKSSKSRKWRRHNRLF